MKNKTYKLILACLAVFPVLFIALPGFSQNSALNVKCVDSSGNPVQNVKVVVNNIDTQKEKDRKSDAQGMADFTKLDDGVYRIVGRKDGFAPAFFEYVQLKGSSEPVTLTFAAGADKKLYFEDEAEAKKAGDLFSQGFELFKQGKFSDAEKAFTESININPSNTDTLYYLALVNFQQGKFDLGMEYLDKAVKIANMLKTSKASDATAQTHYEDTVKKAQQLKLRLPALKADNALRQKKYDEAIAGFNEAIKNEPNNPDFYANLAIALTNAKRLDEAMAAINKADQLKPGAYTELKKNIAARKENEKLSQAQAMMDAGKKLLQDGDAAGALKKFEDAKSLVPEDRQAALWLQIGRAQAKLNQPEVAAASFKKAVELAPEDKKTEFRNSVAQHYLDEKQYDQALDVLSDPKYAGNQSVEDVLLSLAKTAKDSKPQLAEAALERALKISPDNADIYFSLGQMYYADGKSKDTRTKELLTKYVEIGKDADKISLAKDMLIMVNRRSK